MSFRVIRFLKKEIEYNLLSGRFEWLIRNIEFEIDLIHEQMKIAQPAQHHKCTLLMDQLKQMLHLVYRAKSKKFYENEGWIGGLKVRQNNLKEINSQSQIQERKELCP